MIKPSLDLFWELIALPLSWMPPFCLEVIKALLGGISTIVLISIVVKVGKAVKGN